MPPTRSRPTSPDRDTLPAALRGPAATFTAWSQSVTGVAGPRQARIAREMYEETGPNGKRRYTVAQIAAEFGVTRPTVYRHLSRPMLTY